MKWKLLAAVVFFALAAQMNPAAAQSAPPFWKEILAFKHRDSIQMPPQHAILLTGSSSFTKWLDVDKYFPGYTIINRGFGGSTLPDLVRYAYDAILPYKPKQVIIYCGDNDLAASEPASPQEVLHRVKTLFGIIRENLPRATISFISIKPSPARAALQPQAIEANRLVRHFISKKQNAQFINIYDAMLNKDGSIRGELFIADRLHMNADGYAIWKRIMLPYLK